MNKVYIYFINLNFNFVFIRNNNISSLIISRRYKIDFVIEYEVKEKYSIQIKNYFLIIKIIKDKELILKKFINLIIFRLIIEKIIIDLILKTRLLNKIIIYEK